MALKAPLISTLDADCIAPLVKCGFLVVVYNHDTYRWNTYYISFKCRNLQVFGVTDKQTNSNFINIDISMYIFQCTALPVGVHKDKFMSKVLYILS